MAAKSNRNGDIFFWILNVAESCKSFQQLETAKNLANLYLNNKKHHKYKGFNPFSSMFNSKYDELTRKELLHDLQPPTQECKRKLVNRLLRAERAFVI